MDKINFEALPSTKTPINPTNLNKMQENIEKGINKYSVSVADSDFDDVTRIIGDKYEDLKPYTITNDPINDENYIQGGTSHTIIGMEYNNQQYGSQTSFSMVGIKRRRKWEGVWGKWLDVVDAETITNEYGTAILYSDGTMICKGTFLVTCAISNALGNGFYMSCNPYANFPYPFAGERPIINITPVNEWCLVANCKCDANSINGLTLYNIKQDTTDLNYEFDYIAIGRWK